MRSSASRRKRPDEFESRHDGLWGVYRFKRGFGGEVKRAAQALDRLYLQTERWYDLLAVLERQTELAPSAAEVVSLRFRIGELWREHLRDLPHDERVDACHLGSQQDAVSADGPAQRQLRAVPYDGEQLPGVQLHGLP